MNIFQMHRAFEIGVDKIDSDSVPNILTAEMDFFLNQAQDQFVKVRYGGNNVYRTGFEQTQKRTDDLRTIVKRQKVICYPFFDSSGTPIEANVYSGAIPSDYDYLTNLRVKNISAICGNDFIDMDNYKGTTYGFKLGDGTWFVHGDWINWNDEEEQQLNNNNIVYLLAQNGQGLTELVVVDLNNQDGGTLIADPVPNVEEKWEGAKQVQHDDIGEYLSDPFNKPVPEKPLFLFEGKDILMYANEDFIVSVVELTYIKKILELSSEDPTPFNMTDTCELPDHTHQEIVDIAVNIALEDIESPRLATHNALMSKQE